MGACLSSASCMYSSAEGNLLYCRWLLVQDKRNAIVFSTDKNIETFAQLIDALKLYFEAEKEYAKVSVVSVMVKLLTGLILGLVLMLIFFLVVVFSGLALAMWLSTSLGEVGAFAAVAGIFVVVMVLIVSCRKRLIEKPLTKFLAGVILNDK